LDEASRAAAEYLAHISRDHMDAQTLAALEKIAGITAGRDQGEQSALLLGYSRARLSSLGLRDPGNTRYTDVLLARLRTMLDTTEFANAVARGEALWEHEAVEAGSRIVAG